MASLVSHFIPRSVTSLGFATMLSATLSACANTGVVTSSYADERCRSVSEQTDGSWRVERPIVFGRTVQVDGGSTLYKGEVFDGVDLGAVLQRTCRDPSLNLPETIARF
jgi:hypothetical protein